FCVASVLGSSCTTCTLRSCAPYAPINSSKYLCLERSLFFLLLWCGASFFPVIRQIAEYRGMIRWPG
ncbi:MAG: hypothetical protein LBJ16_02075, partial [Holosporaceae bacterium]|nr:hypothetical protein [Holosporaceae bacterium]